VAKERVERDEEDLVRLYLTDIGQYPLLTKDDEVRLAQQIEQGNTARAELVDGAKALTPTKKRELRRTARLGDDAQRTFVQSNLRLVVSIAKKYQASGLPLLDLIQEGNLGLMHAVEKFDWRKGFKFSTYATWWIRQAVQRGVANKARTIRIPVHIVEREQKISRAERELVAKLERAPTDQELAAASKLPLKQVREVRAAARAVASLDKPVGEDDSASFGDLFASPDASPEEQVEVELTEKALHEAIADLSEREQQILELRYGLKGNEEPKSLEQIGRILGVTRERVRQLEAEALRRLAERREIAALQAA
jgi:RNA polymerase sigma factor (sigma-70 family)